MPYITLITIGDILKKKVGIFYLHTLFTKENNKGERKEKRVCLT